MTAKTKKALLGLGAIASGILAIPVAAFVNWAFGLFLLAVPIFLVFMADD